MPRANRRRDDAPDDDRFARFLAGRSREEARSGRAFTVQPVAGTAPEKTYTCPGCGGAIAGDTAHLVVWRADGILGDAADLAARRHWHTACWRRS